MYIRGYMGQLELRRLKFPKNKKKKVEKFYIDFQQYLEEAYFKFELLNLNKNNFDVSTLQFLEFNKDFRKVYKSSKSSKEEYSIIKESARILFIDY